MKGKKRGGAAPKGPKGAKKGKPLSLKDDPFFSKKRRKVLDDEIKSDSDDDYVGGSDGEGGGGQEAEEEDEIVETADEMRKRLAYEHLEKVKGLVRREKEDEDDDSDDGGEKDGNRDSLVAQILQQQQLEDSGRVRRVIASRVQKPEPTDEFRILVKHRQSVTAVCLSDDDSKGFSASKEGTILHWDVDTGKNEKYLWPSNEVLKSHGMKDPQGRVTKHSKHVLALAVSSDGRYLASGGLDRHVHLWDTRTREHIQAFPGHRGPVSCLTFRQGSSELFSGSYDRTVKIWNVEDRAYVNTLFGHQGEILSVDCLRKERVLSVGHDRSMQLFKVPEESRLVFRAPATSLECCCFISNDEFLSGSDDGSIELWNMLRKKPVCIVKNAHPLLAAHKNVEERDGDRIPNGHIGENVEERDGGRIPNGHIGETVAEKDGDGTPNGHIEKNGPSSESKDCSTTCSWISSVSVCRGSDLAASGAGNGYIRLWTAESEAKTIQPLHILPLVGFVNSLAFAKSGGFLVAGVGKEPRLGRWGCIPAAQNGIAIHRLTLSSDDKENM